MTGWLKKWIYGDESKSWLDHVREYRGFLSVHFETEDFTVATAMTGHELLKALELRHEIFVREWQGRENADHLDVDDFDFQTDHLLITDKRSQEVVGTYRLLCSRFTQNFYSQGEFHLDPFLNLPGIKLELGRACIHPKYRNGNTIDLLWKGLARYIEKSRARYLFGCASIKTEDAGQVGDLISTLKSRNEWSDEFQIRATDKYHFPNLNIETAQTLLNHKDHLPPLLRSYFHAGAKVFGHPAWDKEFACVDLLTILDMENLKPRFRERFFSTEVSGFHDMRLGVV